MNLLGVTFPEFCEALQARPHRVPELRGLYARAMRGELCAHAFPTSTESTAAAAPTGASLNGWHCQADSLGSASAPHGQRSTVDPATPNEMHPAPIVPLRIRIGRTDEHHSPCGDFLPVVRHMQDGDLTKFIQRTDAGLETESVIVPMGGRQRAWKTLCISSQVGCAMGCTFCETAQLGFVSQLSPAEIVGQAVAARRLFGAEVRNIVFMGMGEPFDNFDNVIQAVRIFSDPSGMSLAKGHITISTVGRIDGIRKLAALGWKRLNLAVSLNAPNDEIRSRIMPVNRKDNMAALLDALREYPLRNGAHVMIAYVLIPGVNDAREHARELAAWAKPLPCCVNVIPYNPRRDSPWPAPSDESVSWFLSWLMDEGQYCKLRITKGREHMAACGQLGNRAFARRRHAERVSPPV